RDPEDWMSFWADPLTGQPNVQTRAAGLVGDLAGGSLSGVGPFTALTTYVANPHGQRAGELKAPVASLIWGSLMGNDVLGAAAFAGALPRPPAPELLADSLYDRMREGATSPWIRQRLDEFADGLAKLKD